MQRVDTKSERKKSPIFCHRKSGNSDLKSRLYKPYKVMILKQEYSIGRLSSVAHTVDACDTCTGMVSVPMSYSHRPQRIEKMAVHGESRVQPYNGGMETEPPAGFMGRAPGQGVRAQAP